MNESFISGLVAEDEEAIASFGESDNCVVVDWRDGAEEIFEAVIAFLPKEYLIIEKKGDAEWAVKAGGRSPKSVEYRKDTRQEDFFVALNETLVPDFELRQYTPADGDGYSLYLASCTWWKSASDEHPTVVEKYFMPVERLARYMRKGYWARLFSKP